MTPELQYLNSSLIESLDIDAFRAQKPYPWTNPNGMIQPKMLNELISTSPDLSLYTPHFGFERKYGQTSHDHYVLEYEEGLTLPPPWQAFIDELRSDYYRNFVCSFLGTADIGFRFQWHAAPRGAAVPPHCDSKRKIGTHIFYMNSADWNPQWGGQTMILDDEDKFKRNSNPTIDDFPSYQSASISENSSLIFGRGKKSWHAVRALDCPEGAFRKVFIVVYEDKSPLHMLRNRAAGYLKGKSASEKLQSLY